jgi:hypothetical protein
MRDTIAFVHGAVATREGPVPVLTRFHISGGRIQGSNGRIAIDAPCEELTGVEALVPADKFLAAVDSCTAPNISVEENRLVIKDGKFKARLPMQPLEDFPKHEPTPGTLVKKFPAFLQYLPIIRPFVGEDMTRPWCLTTIADGDRIYATNSAMIVSAPCHGWKGQLPSFLIDELVRILKVRGAKEGCPNAFVQDENSVTFHYGKSWLRSQLIVDEWPIDTARDLLAFKEKGIHKFDKALVASIESLIPFCVDPKMPTIHFGPGGIATAPGDTRAEVEGEGWPPCAFDARNLLPMLNASSHFAIDGDKGVGLFYGENGFKGIMRGSKP